MKEHTKASNPDEKASKNAEKTLFYKDFIVWDVDAAGSNPVTPTKIAVLTAQKAAK